MRNEEVPESCYHAHKLQQNLSNMQMFLVERSLVVVFPIRGRVLTGHADLRPQGSERYFAFRLIELSADSACRVNIRIADDHIRRGRLRRRPKRSYGKYGGETIRAEAVHNPCSPVFRTPFFLNAVRMLTVTIRFSVSTVGELTPFANRSAHPGVHGGCEGHTVSSSNVNVNALRRIVWFEADGRRSDSVCFPFSESP